MLKCMECGKPFEEDEGIRKTGILSYYGETPVKEQYIVCPHCGGGTMEPARKCRVCGEWCAEEALNNGVCYVCEESVTVKDCYEISKEKNEKEKVEINSFLAYAFSEKEIETILMNAFLTQKPTSALGYAKDNEEWFWEAFAERG